MNHTAPSVCIHADYGNPFRVHTSREISMDDVLKKITEPYLLFQIERVSSFHGYLSMDGKTIIDQKCCVHCGWCSSICPVEAITVEKPFTGDL